MNADGVIVSWIADASSTGTVILVKQGVVDAEPVDGVTNNPNASFGLGDTLGTSNYVVYAGTATSVTVTSLVYGTPYQVAAYAYAGSGSLIQYRTNNPPTCVLQWPPTGTIYTIR